MGAADVADLGALDDLDLRELGLDDAQKARFVNALEDVTDKACLVSSTSPSTDERDMDTLMLIAELRQQHHLQSMHEIHILAANDLAENTDSDSVDEEDGEDMAVGAGGRSDAANDDGTRGSDGAGGAGRDPHGAVESSSPASGEDGGGVNLDAKTAASSPSSSPRLPFHVRAAAWKQRLRDAADNHETTHGSTFGLHQDTPAHQGDSNTEFIGSSMDRTSRRNSSQTETAWRSAGSMEGLQVFGFDHWKPTYDSAATLTGVLSSYRCYIALKTERIPGARQAAYSVHYVIGCHSSPEEQATACYKAIELRSYLQEASLTREEAVPMVMPDGADQQGSERAEAGAEAGVEAPQPLPGTSWSSRSAR
mmetsp:Transcript_48630/g.136851  ORF Transcript_48630/g.136851 Transcript_48630/m.136851 type:complete len:366 (+) Transcript_48630:284-1381(+)